ncbi:hypothetical protein NKH60_30420 [Mesorhizobium sp. M1006]|uniref:hypothetical protein n=1 Tax=Mesorhizobium sp. M1006 TaxID=2957048 RepID=UPI00333C5840
MSECKTVLILLGHRGGLSFGLLAIRTLLPIHEQNGIFLPQAKKSKPSSLSIEFVEYRLLRFRNDPMRMQGLGRLTRWHGYRFSEYPAV